jgi:hypothetical protein
MRCITPDPRFTYANLTINYSADSLKDSNGNSDAGITGNYGFWVVENIFYYVPRLLESKEQRVTKAPNSVTENPAKKAS